MFIDGLHQAIKTLVARNREQQLKVTYLELVQFARAKRDALCLQNSTNEEETRASAEVSMTDQAGSFSMYIRTNKAPS